MYQLMIIDTLTITVKGQSSKAEEVLKKLKCLESYKLVSEKNGQATFELEAKDSKKDVREEISFALSDARVLIIEMNVSKASLEDVYLDLLQESREAEEAELEEESDVKESVPGEETEVKESEESKNDDDASEDDKENNETEGEE